MADALTTFLNLTNPEVGASSDTWGTKENTDRVTVDAMLSTLITGLTLSAAGSTATFGIAVGAAIGAVLSSAYTKTTSAWALGTAAGSLDTGAIANATWYHVYIIQRSDTGVVDILTSLSASAPTMPTNYDRKRRIGSMKTDGSAQWVKFSQRGDEFLWDVPVQDAAAVACSTSAILTTLSVPTGIQVNALFSERLSFASLTNFCLITSPDQADTTPSSSQFTLFVTSGLAYAQSLANFRTDTSARVRNRMLQADGSFDILTRGWVDLRGKA